MLVKWAVWAGILGSFAIAQEAPKEPAPQLPTSCEVHACLLDPERDPCDPEEIKVQLVFMTQDGDLSVPYPLERGSAPDRSGSDLSWNLRDLEGTHFKVGVSALLTYPTAAQGEKPPARRAFLHCLKSPLVPAAEKKSEEFDRAGKGVYFKLRLEAKDIRGLAAGPWSRVYLILDYRGERKALECFSFGKTKGGEQS